MSFVSQKSLSDKNAFAQGLFAYLYHCAVLVRFVLKGQKYHVGNICKSCFAISVCLPRKRELVPSVYVNLFGCRRNLNFLSDLI